MQKAIYYIQQNTANMELDFITPMGSAYKIYTPSVVEAYKLTTILCDGIHRTENHLGSIRSYPYGRVICVCTPADRIKLGCKHTYHKGCICQLDMPSCPCCRAPILNKYAKKVFTNTKLTPLADKVFSLAPEKQKAFFSIANRLVEIMGDISDTEDGLEEIMVLKSYISTYAFGIKSLKQYNGDGLGIMEDWSVAATTAFEHVRQYDTYDGLSFDTDGINFWVDTQPPQPPQPPPAGDMVITCDQPYVPVQPLSQPRDPRLPATMQFVPVVQFGVVPAQNTLQQTMVGGGDVFPPTPVNIDMDWIPPYSPTAPPYSPTSPSLIRL